MKTTRFLTIPIVGFILLLSLAIPALAAPNTPPIPSSFYGEIHFISGDGGPTAGNYVDAYVPGITGYAARATITTDGGGNLVYAINVPGDDLIRQVPSKAASKAERSPSRSVHASWRRASGMGARM